MKKIILCATMLLLGSIFVGCGNADTQKTTEQTESEISQDEANAGMKDSDETTAEDGAESDMTKDAETVEENMSQTEISTVTETGIEDAGQTEIQSEIENTVQESNVSDGFSFADAANREFYFSSGAGGWYTVVYIHEDGSFDGHYQDSDLGSTGEGYPNGTIYYSDFSGTFTEPKKVNDTTYSFEISSIAYANEVAEEIKDGFCYYYTTAYGLDGAEELYMYLPGTKIADLPEGYTSWVNCYNEDAVSGAELPFYGLYNVTMEEGFSSNEILSALEDATRTIEMAEEAVAELEKKLQNAQTQLDMTEISNEMYLVWDDTLNIIWRILQSELDEDAMDALTIEERAWIAEKETAVKEAAEGCEGGSIQPMIEAQKAAEMTKERVYELLEYLKK